jgi:hypothetical protein
VGSIRSGSRGASRAAANCFVRPMRSSNCRSGNRPASEVSGASDASVWMGRGAKKSRSKSEADGGGVTAASTASKGETAARSVRACY